MYPELFRIGPMPIHSYGVMIATAFLMALWVGIKEAKRKDIDLKLVSDFVTYALIYGILGARLAYVIFFDLQYYLNHPLHILFVWEGGLVLYGGILGGLIAGIWFIKKHKLNFWKFADTLAPSVILGQAIGRIGCFLSGDSYGVPTELPWGVKFPEGSLPNLHFGQIPIHPTQIYESLLNFVIFMVLWKLRKRNTYNGFLFLLYLISYSAMRFFIEFLRGDSLYIGSTPIRSAQLISVAIIALSLLMIPYLKKGWRQREEL